MLVSPRRHGNLLTLQICGHNCITRYLTVAHFQLLLHEAHILLFASSIVHPPPSASILSSLPPFFSIIYSLKWQQPPCLVIFLPSPRFISLPSLQSHTAKPGVNCHCRHLPHLFLTQILSILILKSSLL